ncbi:hypothetical protein NDU88_000806 [Pleurodeles waltl]|uniref:Uncharacterized protein n=1 Tax=Pleurodeles waltl TaxID=8319 RepID=A0AAV7Q281_PLEWA|nr:hypothetical protein NDU88_000806 [Pleurodeles waltl]
MPDAPDSESLKLLQRIIEEVNPQCILTSAKQDQNLSEFLRTVGSEDYSSADRRPEIVLYPHLDFGVVPSLLVF